jgi:GDPmannose 4,6-dehydratase
LNQSTEKRTLITGLTGQDGSYLAELRLGNLDAKRDWGYAKDYVYAMWLMLQQNSTEDYVISSDETRTVRELCEIAFAHMDLDWEKHMVEDPRFYRPAEVHLLLGDSSKTRKQLERKPEVGFRELVNLMVDADLRRVEHEIGQTPATPSS